jgi:hypothetical protein
VMSPPVHWWFVNGDRRDYTLPVLRGQIIPWGGSGSDWPRSLLHSGCRFVDSQSSIAAAPAD